MPYIKVDEIIRMVSKYGPGTLMAKFDVETAYHSIAVHRQVSLLNEMAWLIFCRLTLPDTPEKAQSFRPLHYLDDFITAGPAQSDQCASNLSIAISICRSLGLPRHPSKCIGPCTCMLVLGIDLNLEQQTARLPADKLAALKGLIYS